MLSVRDIKALVRQYNLGFSPRRLGQHFLIQPGAMERIVQVLGPGPGEPVLEIGAGLGALTEALLKTGAAVTAVEKDPRFVRVLQDRFSQAPGLRLVQANVLHLELAALAPGGEQPLFVAGNIPYSLTSPILEFLVLQRRWVRRAVLTTQREVAHRILAKPGTKAYTGLTLLVQVAFRPSLAFTLAPSAFYPKPEVTSAVLRMDPLRQPVVPPEDEAGVLRMIRRIFLHRRKTLLNALITGGSALPREEIAGRLKAAGIDPSRRPETLDLTQLHRLYRQLAAPPPGEV